MKMKKTSKSERGTAAVEAAFIFPMMFLIYFSVHDLTALITAKRKLSSAAATVGDTVAQASASILRSSISDIFNSVPVVMQPIDEKEVSVDVYGYRLDGTTMTQRWKVASDNGPVCPAPETSTFMSLMSASNDIVVTVSCMNYKPFIGTFLGQNLLGSTTFLLSQQVTSRPRTSATLDCLEKAGSTDLCKS